MGMTDPIADMLTCIRNALQAGHKELEVPGSCIKIGVADVLKREGYIKDYKFEPDNKQGLIKIYLKPAPVIQGLRKVSKPGRRVYTSVKKIPRVQDGFGIAILSTPQGILSDREARKAKVGGEVLAYIW
ncbi:MAG: 30S ribosomal protein S8 [bacterium]|nr:30S ribosomal protein S8 [bacterium]